MNATTVEKQYQFLLNRQIARFGLMSSQVYQDDPKRLCFLLARYKFVAKMLAGRDRVLEVGCADAFATPVVCQAVNHVTAVDFDPLFIENARARSEPRWNIDFRVHDLLKSPVNTEGGFDAVYCCDVIEHIKPADEALFLKHLSESLNSTGVLIVGTPSLESQPYASPQSKEGHVNCKSGEDLRRFIQNLFHTVFLFSMNDEVVHTGFYPMAHYLFAIGCHRKE